jgi:hypothetical protein
MYWVIHLTIPDGRIGIYPCRDEESAKKYAERMNLHDTEYAVIKGTCEKNMGQYVWNK